MEIVRAEAIPLSIPFSAGDPRAGGQGQAWRGLDCVLIRVETESGLVGWGEAFSYNCRRAVTTAFEDMVAPVVVGRSAADIAGLMTELQQCLHLFGRYGITLFALSGLDIALWDLAAGAADLPLARLLGGPGGGEVPGYASLFRYGDAEVVAERTKAALGEGYRYVKLHEIHEPEVAAARDAAGPEVPIMLDTNCPWTPAGAREMARKLKPYDLHWLEEPIFPPEDFAALARLRADCGIAIAAGENACTAFQFRKVVALPESAGVALMPHAPYFGPGFLATLQLMAALPHNGLAEWFYLDREACLYGEAIRPRQGTFRVPEGPGLGVEPDPDVIKTYRTDG